MQLQQAACDLRLAARPLLLAVRCLQLAVCWFVESQLDWYDICWNNLLQHPGYRLKHWGALSTLFFVLGWIINPFWAMNKQTWSPSYLFFMAGSWCDLLLSPCPLPLAPCSLLLAPCCLLLAACALRVAPCALLLSTSQPDLELAACCCSGYLLIALYVVYDLPSNPLDPSYVPFWRRFLRRFFEPARWVGMNTIFIYLMAPSAEVFGQAQNW